MVYETQRISLHKSFVGKVLIIKDISEYLILRNEGNPALLLQNENNTFHNENEGIVSL